MQGLRRVEQVGLDPRQEPVGWQGGLKLAESILRHSLQKALLELRVFPRGRVGQFLKSLKQGSGLSRFLGPGHPQAEVVAAHRLAE